MKRMISVLIVAGVTSIVAFAGPLSPQGGTITAVAGASGGGLTGGGTGGPVYLGLLTTCGTGQTLKWSGTAWACADLSSVVAGTVNHVPYFTPDGSHLGDTPITYDGSTNLLVPIPHPQLGRGIPLGQPPFTPSGVTAGAGVLTGTCKYEYTESAGGQSLPSPAGSVVASSNSIDVTVPLPRRGVSQRKLYRDDCAGGAFLLVHDFGGGSYWASTHYTDNTPYGSLGAAAPTSDASIVWSADLDLGIKTFRTHPDQGANPADVAVLTSDPSTYGAFAMDIYGPVNVRTATGVGFASQKTAGSVTPGYHFVAYYLGATDTGQPLTDVYHMTPEGFTTFAPLTMLDDSVSRPVTITATMPTTTTGSRRGIYNQITSAGSSSNSQIGMETDLLAGYTGTSPTYGDITQNFAAGSQNIASMRKSQGAGLQNVGLAAVAINATFNVPLFAGMISPPAGHSAMVWADNGGLGAPLFIGTRGNATTVFEVQDGGALFSSANGNYLTADGALGCQPGTNGTATCYWDYYGYAPGDSLGMGRVPGTTQFRTSVIANGKGAAIATFTGSSLAAVFAGTGSFAGALTMNSNKITSLANGSASSDAAAFGQIGSAVTAAVSGTANTTTKFTGTNTVGNGWALDDGTTWGVSSRFTIAEATGAFVASSTGSLGGALNMNSHQINNVTNGSSAQDAAAFGQIATAINTAVSGVGTGTSGRVAVFDATNAVTGYSGFTSDSSGNISANQATVVSSGNYFWGDQTTKIHGINGSVTGAGITFFTNSTLRFTIDGTGLLTNAGAFTNTGAATLSSTLHLVGAGTFDSTALVTGVLTTTAAAVFNGGFAANANSTVTGTLAVSSTFTDAAHIVSLTSGGTPTVLSCGSGSSITGTDSAMIITPGTGLTTGSCSYTFAHAYTNVPACTANATNVADGYLTVTATNAAVLVTDSTRNDFVGKATVTCTGINGT